MKRTKKGIVLRTGRHWIKGAIFYSELFVSEDFPIVDRQAITEHIDILDDFIGNKKMLFLSDVSTSDNILSFDALRVWGGNESLNKHRLAEAFVVSSLADVYFFKQYIRLNDLAYQAKVFNDKKEAVNWLSEL
ncbi:DUF7793 family protein [Fulvivirga lutea]|uniref:DUF7793 domain-containing protein n=1 Tax=Fulvivirga lutea TaxID=2810512 RepID=A0A974WJ18_9BACT|nr:hypothetical protein [Fulvivirga lutea]QSE98824.1 hypothetical protein JR347_07020 [Fulvivirga lutea]